MRVWQESRKLVVEVYRLLGDFPKFENYALCDQIRRAIVSVPSKNGLRSSLFQKINCKP
ncbi:MAG: four helix bundle protein [Prevotella sp.]|nr:four helix bundle protein [Prevotella sp.]